MKKKTIPDRVSQIPPDYVYLTPIAKKTFGIVDDKTEDRDKERPYLALKYFDSSWECFSDWNQSELKNFSAFIDKLKIMNWRQVLESPGFGYKLHKNRNQLPNKGMAIREVSPDISASEIRVTQRVRIHGFRINSAYFLVWLDKDHRVFKQ